MIKKLRPVNFGKIMAVIYALFGAVVGAMFTLLAMMGLTSPADAASNPMVGLHSIIVFPILYGIVGILSGLITACIYNLAAKWFGGIILETE